MADDELVEPTAEVLDAGEPAVGLEMQTLQDEGHLCLNRKIAALPKFLLDKHIALTVLLSLILPLGLAPGADPVDFRAQFRCVLGFPGRGERPDERSPVNRIVRRIWPNEGWQMICVVALPVLFVSVAMKCHPTCIGPIPGDGILLPPQSLTSCVVWLTTLCRGRDWLLESAVELVFGKAVTVGSRAWSGLLKTM